MKSIPRHTGLGLTQHGSKTVLTQHQVNELKQANIKLVQNTVQLQRDGPLGNSAQEPLVSKAFIKAAQVNKNMLCQQLLRQSVNLYYS